MSKNITSIFVAELLNGENGVFDVLINCPFKPKTVTLSNISYANDAAVEPGFALLSTNLITSLDNIIAIFRDEQASAGDNGPMTFACDRSVQGTHQFSYQSAVPRQGILVFALTFKD